MVVAVSRIKLRIFPPTEPAPPGRGFYQLEEEALHIPIGVPPPDRRFFSWLESDSVQMDIDRLGKLLFLVVNRPRRQWTLVDGLTAPKTGATADVRWINFRTHFREPGILTNRRRSVVEIAFAEEVAAHTYYLAEHVILQADLDIHPTSLWVTDIIDDLAGQEIMAFRQMWRLRTPSAGTVGPEKVPVGNV